MSAFYIAFVQLTPQERYQLQRAQSRLFLKHYLATRVLPGSPRTELHVDARAARTPDDSYLGRADG